MNGARLSPADIYGSDPLARLLLKHWALTPTRFSLLVFGLGLGYLGGLSLLFGYFWPRAGIVPSQLDLFNQLNFFGVIPVVAFYYLWQPMRLTQVYEAVGQRLRVQGEAADHLWQTIRQRNVHAGWWLAGIVVSLGGMAAGAYDNWFKIGVWWYAANGLMIIILQVMRGLVFYMLCVILARHLAATLGLNSLYQQFEMPVFVLRFQQMGGLRSVSQYAFSFTALAAVVGLNLGIAPLLATRMGVDYPYQVLAYFLLAPAGFFLPLWQAHQHMVRNKKRALDDLTTRFHAEHQRLLASVSDDDQTASTSLKRLEIINAAYEWTKKGQTWPFNTATLYRLGVTILAPFAVKLAQVIIEYFIKLNLQ